MDARTTWPALLSALIRGDSLTADESEWAMNEIMEGAATPSQIAGFGIALRIKGTSVAEMTGLARSMLAHATPISMPGQLTDLVGTGGDGARTVNVSTMGTIVAAAAGARMIKHGNRAASSACGAADVLEALGVVIDLPPAATTELAASARSAHALIDAAGPDVQAAAQRMHSIADNLASASEQLDRVIADNREDVRSFARDGLPELERFAREGREAAEDIRALSNSLRENPAQLIYQPQERGVEIPR